MATAPANKPAAAATPEKKDKPKKDPKPLLQRLDEAITRAVIGKKLTLCWRRGNWMTTHWRTPPKRSYAAGPAGWPKPGLLSRGL